MTTTIDTLIDKDACELLDADHIATKHLFVEYARLAYASQGRPDRSRQAIARRICAALTVHAQIEEEIFYPALQETIGQPRLLELARAEHQQAKELIAKIEAARDSGPGLDELVSLLDRVVEMHVKEERDLLFPKAKALLDLEAVGAQLRERQGELEGR